MGRQRSEDMETDSVPRRVLGKAAAGPDEIGLLAVRKRHQWPASTDGDILAPGAVGERHLEREIRETLGKSTVHHVTATAEPSQSIAAGGATVQWGSEADAPTEREGFETFSTQLAAGSVGDIPIDRDGFLILKPKLQFEDSATGTALDETGVDATVKVQRIRDGVVKTVRGALSGTDVIGLSGPIDCGDAKNGDKFRVTIDPGEGIKCSGTIQAAQWITGQSAAAGWTQVFDGDVWGLTQDDSGNWWATEGAGETVAEYDADWTLQSSFEQAMVGTAVRGITWDGTNLWLTGDDNTTGTSGDDQVHETATDGTEVSEFTVSAGGGNAGLAYDGTDVWVVDDGDDKLFRYTTAGTREQTVDLPGDRQGLAYHDGRLYLVDQGNALIEVRDPSDGSVIDTIDVSGATENPTGVFVADDGTIYVAEDGAGVWRRD